MLHPDFLRQLRDLVGAEIIATTPVLGGDVNRSYRLDTAGGRSFFLKTNRSPVAPDMFRSEQLGLALLGASQVIAVPKVLAQGPAAAGEEGAAFLLMEFVASGWKNRLFWEQFGIALANLHGNASEWFGFSHDNYIGTLPQTNTRHKTWPEFYTNERLLPQMILALDQQLLDGHDAVFLENICRKLAMLCPDESPALIHGDLWSGNFICRSDGQPVLIDPAACFAHREMDLAMARLFGGFDTVFYESYQAAWPLDPGFDKRLEIYQLYYLLVHLNLFGGGYAAAVREVLRRFGG